jgi:hypothetical protein
MHVSTHTIRRTATLAVIVAALAAIGAPVAQADRGFTSPDALDRALIVATAEKTAMLDARERALSRSSIVVDSQTAMLDARERALIRSSIQDGNFRASPDVVERAVRAHQTARVAEGPDVFERTATAGQLAYLVPATTANGFDWNDFGVGAALGAGALLLLGVIGVGLLVAHRRAGGPQHA